MTSSKFRALAAALLLSTATAASVALLSSTPVAAATVRPQVGQALQAAIKDANAGQGSAAMAKIHEAESVSGLTSSEQQVIAQTKEYVAAKTGQGATGAKVKFANDYNAGRYSAVVGEDADALRKSGAMDGQSAVIVAQAYYLMHDYDSCIRHIRDLGHVGQSTLELLNRCAYEAHDEQTQQTALEQLVVDYNQTKYWSDLLSSADRTGGMTTGDTLDVYRLRFLSGTMRPAPATDYETATEIAVQLGFPSEAALYAQKGIDTKALDATRGAKLLNLAKSQIAADVAALPKTQAAANAAKNGDALVKLGQDFWGMGKYQDAVSAIKAGIAKGASNPDEAQIHLAMAYTGLHQREAALQALKAVSKSAAPATQTIARLWSIYARTQR
jgi:tetratricopeptide (TPR) repeat protein